MEGFSAVTGEPYSRGAEKANVVRHGNANFHEFADWQHIFLLEHHHNRRMRLTTSRGRSRFLTKQVICDKRDIAGQIRLFHSR